MFVCFYVETVVMVWKWRKIENRKKSKKKSNNITEWAQKVPRPRESGKHTIAFESEEKREGRENRKQKK